MTPLVPAVLLSIVTMLHVATPSALDDDLARRITGLANAAGAEVAVAFRTLDGRDALRVRADESYHAASTMKVPVMIEMFRQARLGFFRLDDRIPVTNRFRSVVDGSSYSLTVDQEIEPELHRFLGQPRTYRELCEAMITVSSNLATNVLVDRLGVEKIQQTSLELGAMGMNVRRGVEDDKAFQLGLNNTTSAGALLTLLTAIAEGRAVSPEDSREMVEIMKRTRARDRIPAGLPAGTPVAHKTGTVTKIQHDAAIVYRPRPYVLVVLVRGVQDEAAGARLIADITRAIDGAVQ